jgi:CheY-like chemotaxis protein
MNMPNILLAEDNPTNAMMIQMMLEAVGHPVTCVGNGREAVDAAALQAFDLILMDVQMPLMDGLTAIRQIREAEAATGERPSRIYTITTNSLPADVRAAFDAGADGHITKPLAPGVLLDAIASIRAHNSGKPLERPASPVRAS